MKTISLIVGCVMAFGVLAGCSQKTPEEIEAAKYPQVQQNSPEKDRELESRSSMHGPPPANKFPPK